LEFFQLLAQNLEASYRASRGEAGEPEMELLRRAQELLERASQQTTNATRAYRVQKLLAAHEKWTPKFRPVAKLDFSGSAGHERTAEL
jgi:hypothetical protein